MSGFTILPGDFPYNDLCQIAEFLKKLDVFTPGYTSPGIGFYHPDGYIYAHHIENIRTVLLPDRNIVSRLAKIAQGELVDIHKQKAAAVLAFAQCLDIEIEPSIAFHELIPSQGNDLVLDELSWFRTADNGDVHEWIKIALGLKDRLPAGLPTPVDAIDLTLPLRRWRRNYIAVLKIGELELSGKSHIEKILALLDWMYDDFILAGPAAMLACIYFAPNSPPRKNLLKQLRSQDRNKAIDGIKNAAWDVTHLSDFILKINNSLKDTEIKINYIFATLDEGLHTIANLLLENNNCADELATALGKWWPSNDAKKIAQTLYGNYQKARSPDWWTKQENSPNLISKFINNGEKTILTWCK